MKRQQQIETQSIEERLIALEREVAELRKENKELSRKMALLEKRGISYGSNQHDDTSVSIEEALMRPVPPIVFAEKMDDSAPLRSRRGGASKNAASAQTFAELIKERISARDRILLIIDGHNVMNLSRNYSRGTHESQRNAFTADMSAIRKKLGDAFDMRIYFDGPEESVYGSGKNTTVVFSGGDGNNRADRKIVDYLRLSAATGKYTKIVTVTEDQELRGQALSEGSLLLYPPQFLSLVSD